TLGGIVSGRFRTTFGGTLVKSTSRPGSPEPPKRRLPVESTRKEPSMSRYSRLAPALVAFALLSASPVLPQTRPGPAAPRTASLGEALRDLLPEFLTRLWGNLGCSIVPYGGACRPAAAHPAAKPSFTTVTAAAGCGVDPYGGCLPRPTVTPTDGH